jgi:hypothetical protein
MIIRLATFAPMTPEIEVESRRNLTERFMPALQSQPGFIAGYWARGEDGRPVSITVWESVEAAQQGAVAANAMPLLPGQDPEKLPSPANVETLQVVAHG